MAQEIKPRLVRVDDFVAETLESEADMMPPWTNSSWHLASVRRTYGRLHFKMVRVWKNRNRKSVAASCVNEWGQSKFPWPIASDELSLYRLSLDSITLGQSSCANAGVFPRAFSPVPSF
jgi:hypothetical protein